VHGSGPIRNFLFFIALTKRAREEAVVDAHKEEMNELIASLQALSLRLSKIVATIEVYVFTTDLFFVSSIFFPISRLTPNVYDTTASAARWSWSGTRESCFIDAYRS
jgi:predicted DCC family thiol-disulfide oxidoreductase YuxK